MSHELRVERLIDAAPVEVFDVFVDAEAQKEWYLDPEHPDGLVETECDARVGGLWTSAWGPGEDELYRETCVFRVVDGGGGHVRGGGPPYPDDRRTEGIPDPRAARHHR